MAIRQALFIFIASVMLMALWAIVFIMAIFEVEPLFQFISWLVVVPTTVFVYGFERVEV